MQHLLATIIATTACACGQAALAQSIEPVRQHITLGQPPVLHLHVRGFETDPSRLGPDCIQVRLIQGEHEIPAEATQVRTTPLAEDGKVLVQIRSSAEVSEPVVRALVQLSCGADYARELTLLADPPATSTAPHRTPPAASVARVARMHTARPAVAAAPPANDPTERATPVSVSAAPTRGTTPPPTPGTGGARLSLEEPALDRLVSAVLAALDQRQPQPQRLLAAPRDQGLRPIEADWLREMQQMQEEQRQSRAQLAALQLRLERQESDTLQRWGAIAATAGGVLAGALLLRIARERLLPRLSAASHAHHSPDPRVEPPEPTLSSPLPAADSVASWHDATPPAATAPPLPWPEAGSTTEAPPHAPLSGGTTPRPRPRPRPSTDPAAAQAPAGPPRAAAAPPRQWVGADFGEPSLAGNGHAPAVRQVDRMIADGYHGAAATILENALQTRPGKSPWLLLRLLDLYRAMDQPWNHERVSAQLEALYNLRVPPMGPTAAGGADAIDEGQSLDDRPDLLERLAQVWAQPSIALDWLRARLLRESGLPTVDLATFRDLLLLYDLARLLDEPLPDPVQST